MTRTELVTRLRTLADGIEKGSTEDELSPEGAAFLALSKLTSRVYKQLIKPKLVEPVAPTEEMLQ